MPPAFNDIQEMVRPSVRGLKAYHVNEPDLAVKLHANESPFNLDDRFRASIAKELENLDFNRYPDPACASVREVFASQLSVSPEQILLGNGSDELIQMIIMAFGGQGGQVIVPSPTFSMYRNISLSLGEDVKMVPLTPSFDLDLPAMLSAHGGGHGITFISYPNNPTGNCFSEEAITEILNRSEGIVVVDEAYFDYSRKSFIGRLKDYPNMIVLRTLSKIGLASLRLGILIASERIADIVNRVRLPYNIGSMQQAVACAALKSRGHIDACIGQVLEERGRVSSLMAGIDEIELFPSDSNFILFRAKDADKIYNGLISRGVLIRNLNSDGPLMNCLRVTIGTTGENDLFLDALKDCLRKK